MTFGQLQCLMPNKGVEYSFEWKEAKIGRKWHLTF